jgi:hypothetical protein
MIYQILMKMKYIMPNHYTGNKVETIIEKFKGYSKSSGIDAIQTATNQNRRLDTNCR